jgi:hypothetical protein
MLFYPESAVERAMKIQEVILRAMAKDHLGPSGRNHGADARRYQRYQRVRLRRALRPSLLTT